MSDRSVFVRSFDSENRVNRGGVVPYGLFQCHVSSGILASVGSPVLPDARPYCEKCLAVHGVLSILGSVPRSGVRGGGGMPPPPRAARPA